MINNKSQQAFTLIELAIVLVIIGLIVGGVLVGQDLIRSAEIGATVKQVQNFNAASSTFRNKYNALPGDMAFDLASSFGFNVTSMDGTTGLRDGNYVLTDAGSSTSAYGENLLFWRDLSDAKLIGEITNPGAVDYTTVTATNVNALGSYIPAAKLGKNNFFIVYGDTTSGINYYQIIRTNAITGAAYTGLNVGLTATQAYNIDLKLDDGRPNSGIVTAYVGTATPDTNPTTTSAGNCASNTTATATYSSTLTNQADMACSLKIRMD